MKKIIKKFIKRFKDLTFKFQLCDDLYNDS